MILYGLLLVFGCIAAVSDIKTRKIPNKLIIAMLCAWMFTIVIMLLGSIDTAAVQLLKSAIGFVFCAGLFLLVYIVSGKGLGGGDVKFMAAAGLYLGIDGAVPVILFGTVLAALTGMVLILLKKIRRKDPIPLAPFLFTGMLITAFL